MRPVDLPEPSPPARAASERLRALIADRIVRAGGWLGFDAYMGAALYEPGLGYYAGGAHKFGADGDFVTAPEISPLFGECLAQQCLALLVCSPRLLEARCRTIEEMQLVNALCRLVEHAGAGG